MMPVMLSLKKHVLKLRLCYRKNNLGENRLRMSPHGPTMFWLNQNGYKKNQTPFQCEIYDMDVKYMNKFLFEK